MSTIDFEKVKSLISRDEDHRAHMRRKAAQLKGKDPDESRPRTKSISYEIISEEQGI